jgi:hypothetical protein
MCGAGREAQRRPLAILKAGAPRGRGERASLRVA